MGRRSHQCIASKRTRYGEYCYGKYYLSLLVRLASANKTFSSLLYPAVSHLIQQLGRHSRLVLVQVETPLEIPIVS